MAVLPIRVLPDTVLRQKAKRIRNIDTSLLKLMENMVETMHEATGVGLAANQIGLLQKIAVIQLPEDEEPRILINPEITHREGEREVEEGCLSIPGYRGLVRRSVTVRVKARDQNGKVVRIKAQDLLAQALEHETDHLNGVLYIDHLVDRDKLWKLEPQEEESEVSSTPSPAESGERA